MKNITRHTGTVTNLTRMESSYCGNPRYSFMLKVILLLPTENKFFCKSYKVQTPVDSSYGYCIANYENKVVCATIGTHYGKLSLNSIEA